MRITAIVDVKINDLIAGMDREDSLALIEAIDLKFAEVDFTLKLINARLDSLRSDLTIEEIKKELGFE